MSSSHRIANQLEQLEKLNSIKQSRQPTTDWHRIYAGLEDPEIAPSFTHHLILVFCILFLLVVSILHELEKPMTLLFLYSFPSRSSPHAVFFLSTSFFVFN